jgi:hypothetical protein
MAMNLDEYFKSLIHRVETSDIQNNGMNKDGFYQPTRSVLMQKLNILKDLHPNALKAGTAKTMVRASWQFVVDNVPAEWLVLDDEQKAALKKILD